MTKRIDRGDSPSGTDPEDFDDFEDDLEGAAESLPEMLDEEGRPIDPEWVREHLGPAGFGDPDDLQMPTKLRETLSTTPIFNATQYEGANRWLVEQRNYDTGQADFLGYEALTVSLPLFIKRNIEAMPERGDDPADFYFTPMDKGGSRLGPPGKPEVLPIPWNNKILLSVRERAEREKAASLQGEGAVTTLLQAELERSRQQMEEMVRRAEAAEERARAAQDKAAEARYKQAAELQQDVSAVYTRANEAQTGMFAGVIEAQKTAAEVERERAKQERDAERERVKREMQEERERREAAMREERERRQAEIKERLDSERARNDFQMLQFREGLEVKKAELEAQIRREELKAQEEQRRWEKEREEARERRSEEEARRRATEDRRDKMWAAEREAERNRREAEDQRVREHQAMMETSRQEMWKHMQEMNTAERTRQSEHASTMLGLIRDRTQGAGNLGVFGQVLDALGWTPSEAMEKAKGLLGVAETSVGSEVVKGLSEVVKTFIERMPPPDQIETWDDDDDEVEEEEERPRRRRQIARDEADDITERKPRERKKAPRPPKDDGTPVKRVIATAGPPPREKVDLVVLRAEREAVADLVDSMEEAGQPTTWGETLLGLDNTELLVQHFERVGLVSALEPYDVDPAEVGAALVEMGLFDKAPMRPTKRKPVEPGQSTAPPKTGTPPSENIEEKPAGQADSREAVAPDGADASTGTATDNADASTGAATDSAEDGTAEAAG